MTSDSRPPSNDLEELSAYVYEPLPGPQYLRVLKVSPAPRDQATIHCRLERCSDYKVSASGTSSAKSSAVVHSYEALSWCWGVGAYNQSIRIAENEKAYHFRIYEHLYEAILALRYTDRVRNLWIDMICINQEDLKERNQQVAKMSEVYGNATNVCVWLGKSTQKSGQALMFIKNHLLRMDSFDSLCRDQKYIDSWTALLELMKRPWFSRRWVVQEVSLAPSATVHCGLDSVPWEDFAAAVSLFVDVDTSVRRLSKLVRREQKFNHADDFFKEVPALGATRLVKITTRLFKRSPAGFLQRTSTLEDIVAHLAMFESSEPRDTIYALLALAKDSQPSVGGIPDHFNGERLTEGQKKSLATIGRLLPNPYRQSYVVNYRQHVVDVYQQFIAFAISKSDPTRALDIICRPFAPSYTRAENIKFDKKLLSTLTEDEKLEIVQLPSWIPDRSGVPFSKRNKPRKGHTHEMDAVFSMERQHGDPFVSTPDVITYCAAGSKAYHKDRVRFRKRSDHWSMFVEGFVLDTVVEVEPAALFGNIPKTWVSQGRKHSQSDPDVFWKTLVADRSPKGHAPLYYKNAIEAALEHVPTGNPFNVGDRIRDGTSDIVATVLQQVQATIWERSLVVTGRGLLGLAPNTTQKGDVVCILYGCSVPVIMRKVEKSQEQMTQEQQEDETDRLKRQEKLKPLLEKLFQRQKEKRAKVHATIGRPPREEAEALSASHHADGTLPRQVVNLAVPRGRMIPRQPGRWTTFLMLIACAMAYSMHERLSASLLAALALPHLLIDLYGAPPVYHFWSHKVQLGQGAFVISIMVVNLSFIVSATGSSVFYVFEILALLDAVSPAASSPFIARQYHQCRAAISKVASSKILRSALGLILSALDFGGTPSKFPSSQEKRPTRPDDEPLRDYYTLVGESYIHRMMNGEAIQLQNESALGGLTAKRILPEIFELR